ncbi:ABC transporter permease [Pseudoalteromonas byunsanensis]|uniref:ABC transporter ATP-binding protein n=1 Tax=Pseudoalteromonas byunsanensis TaxID=327939 RepID=A0A1S1N0J4_9GAMM|nr:ABC transporter permease [Pseudoalteromonas byunsanensis]OHU94558.1 ABC transporter ATP-binding protein [Pseudoalteromonas byunsanensis]
MLFHYLDLSWRSFKRTPTVSVLMVLAIAIGIGVTMTSLSVYYMMAKDPIPSKSKQLHHVQLQTMDDGNTYWSKDDVPFQVTYQDAMNLLNANLPYERTAMYKSGFSVHLDNDQIKPFKEPTRLASKDIFQMFNLQFLYGGAWTQQQQDDVAPVVVISKRINDKLFNGENSVGRTLYLDDMRVQVVGIIEDWDISVKFYDLNNGSFKPSEGIFMPITMGLANEIFTWGNTNGWKNESDRTFSDLLVSESLWLQFWVELENAQEKADFEQFLMNYMIQQQSLGRFNRDKLSANVFNVMELMEYRGVVKEDNKIMVTLSFMFLAVCVANILSLLLAKFLRRAPEVGVRRALGASKWQVFYQHLVEVSLLGLFGGLLGIVIAQLGLWGVRASNGSYNTIANMDLNMLLAAPSIAIVACIIAGLYPAWLVCRTTPAVYLKTQ